MAGAITSVTHVTDPLVKNILISKTFNADKYGFNKMFTKVATDQDDVLIAKFDAEQAASRIENLESNDDSDAVQVKFQYSTEKVRSKTLIVSTRVTNKEGRNTLEPILNNHEKMVTEGLMKLIHQKVEKDAENLLTTSGNYTMSNTEALTSGDRWDSSDYGTSHPYITIEEWIEIINQNAEEDVNAIGFPKIVFTQLANHPDTIAKMKTTEHKVLTENDLKILLSSKIGVDVKNLYVLNNFYNSSETATPTKVRYWGKNFLAFYKNPSANYIGGQNFATLYYPKQKQGLSIRKYWARDQRSYFIDVEFAYNLSIQQECGFLGTTVID